jgi:hypothetical protein
MVTTLFFGLSRRDQPDISEAAWQDFLSAVILPQVPGATIADGRGYFRTAGGAVTTEASRLAIIGHPGGPALEHAFTNIIEQYRTRFQQWGVGRADSPACTNFD